MPRLSDFLVSTTKTSRVDAGGEQQAAALPARDAPAPAPAAAPAATPSVLPSSKDSNSSTTTTSSSLARLQQLQARRLRDHGVRRYRHADGSLRLEPPSPNPLAVVSWCDEVLLAVSEQQDRAKYLQRTLPARINNTQANRRRWWPLVQHCRTAVAAEVAAQQQSSSTAAPGGALLFPWAFPPELQAQALGVVGESSAAPEVLGLICTHSMLPDNNILTSSQCNPHS